MTTTIKHTRGLGRRAAALLLLLATGIGFTACDFLDPTNVDNPRTTEDDLAEAEEPTAALLPGLRAQFARLISSNTVVSEVVSDNFSIHGTGLFKEWDFPNLVSPSVANSTGEATGNYWSAQELKALSTFVIEDIVPGDDTADPQDIAEAYYYRGMAYLHLGENFSHAPVVEDGPAVPSDELIQLAIADLGQATGGGPVIGVAAQAALARAYRWAGNAQSAQTAAQGVLNSSPDFLWAQGFDAGSVQNNPYFFLVLRALQEMQPLPRLDFLDPKYLDRTQAIPVAKAEEMHLILAEIALVSNNYGQAAGLIATAVEQAQGRASSSFFDDDPRLNADLSIRPRDSEILIRADANAPYRAGLVLTRPGDTSQRVISGSSLDPDSVAALTDPDAVWHAFHLARQEILFLEGRRMADLGIKLPIMLREIDANPNFDITSDDPWNTSFVPSYIPADDGMDLYDPVDLYDLDENLVETEVTIRYDMNRILATNRVSPFRN
jgi:tetratricopeptide (TPR) repeat protein